MEPSDPSQPLRQGDICAIPHIPIWHIGKAGVVSSPDPKIPDQVSMTTWERAERHPDKRSLVVVASQCCDLENPRNRIGVLVAPVMKIPAKPGSEQFEDIFTSGELDSELRAYRWIQLFPFALPEIQGFTAREVVADTSALTTMAPAEDAIGVLHANRMFTASDDERRQFRVKLAAMVGRDPDRQWEQET